VTHRIDLQPADMAILQPILRDHLSPTTIVWVFGSRVTGCARRYSDLDLALQGDAPLDWGLLDRLKDALSESDLTIKVDLVDLRAVNAAFREIIKSEMVLLPQPSPT
jgi:predicted nucleotidyltransferase